MGGKFPVSKLKDQEVKAHQELERQEMEKILDQYLLICRKAGVMFLLFSFHIDSSILLFSGNIFSLSDFILCTELVFTSNNNPSVLSYH